MVDENNLERLFTFSTNSKGGLGAVGRLSSDYGKHIKLKPNDMPVIRLESDSYIHPNKKYGEIRFPVFQIIKWISSDTLPRIEGIVVNRDEIPF